ncbi:MAG TPA: hypothetical protein VHB72_02660 [Candidatus Saccharimonadales bacterium]|nr:hypothetical protein [Candidatus Saccharimonadales bacterium]
MSNKNALSSQENVESEELLLVDIQTQHVRELERLGITEKAKGLIDPRNLNHLSKASVSVSYDQGEDGEVIEKPTICFTTPSVNTSGYRQTHFSYAEVAEIGPDSMALSGDFTMQDLEAVEKMIAGLREAKELGVLPHLSSNLTSISNPGTAMMRPPESA